jgi:predicted membrane GTPase involved in stress response
MEFFLKTATQVSNSHQTTLDIPEDIEVRDVGGSSTIDPISRDAAATRYEGGLIVIRLGEKNGVVTYAANNVTSRTGLTYNVLAAFMVSDEANLYLEKTKFKGLHTKVWKTYEEVEQIVRDRTILDGVGVFEGTSCVDFWLVQK